MELAAALGDADLVASDTLFVERLASAFLPTPPFPLPPVSCWLLFRGVSSPAAHHSPPEIPSRQFHPIYARETVWSGKRKDPPLPSFPSPGFSGWSSQCDPRLRGPQDVQKEPNPNVDCQRWGPSTPFTT